MSEQITVTRDVAASPGHWSGVRDPGFTSIFPMITEAMLSESLDRIDKAVG